MPLLGLAPAAYLWLVSGLAASSGMLCTLASQRQAASLPVVGRACSIIIVVQHAQPAWSSLHHRRLFVQQLEPLSRPCLGAMSG